MDVDIARLHLLVRSFEEFSDDPNAVEMALEKCGLSEADLLPSVQAYSAQKEACFVRAACDALGDITFAAKTGIGFTSSSSITAYIGKYSRDLRQALENTSRFHDIIDPAIMFSLRIAGNFAAFEAEWKDPSFARYHRRTEFLIFAAVARMRSITQSTFFPIEIRLQHEAGPSAKDIQKMAGFPVIFGAEKLEIILSLSSLDLPIPTYDPRLREHLIQYGARLLNEYATPQNKLRPKVEGLITRSLPGNIVQADEVAGNLGMSPRTFARRLKDEGASYREILDDLRCDLAQTFIKNGMNLSEISFSLGYADQAAFSTAFKRWTGQAPSAFRNRVEHPIVS